MKEITRKSAIKIIWSIASKRGWNYAKLHEWISNLQFVRYSRISCCSGAELSEILKSFGSYYFVRDPKQVTSIISMIKQDSNKNKFVVGVLRKWKKKSIYQLNVHQLGFLYGKLVDEVGHIELSRHRSNNE